MPAKNLHRKDEDGIYSHIYNKGVEKRIIFNDEEDYKVFQGFLKGYLTAPQDPESLKKDFSVHGRNFRGTPHQPKNYLNKVELVAYSLLPEHFHLLLYQKTHGSIESFIRSLCTRYSIYFNKKYKRNGALFEGPYKSIQIEDGPNLLHMTRYLHQIGGYCSYAEYLGTRVTSWVKPMVLPAFFDKGTAGYKDFVEKYQLDQKEKELIEGLTFESETAHLERRDLARNVQNYAPKVAESSEEVSIEAKLKPLQRIPESLAATIIFSLLVAIGITNITVTQALNPSQAPAVLSETTKTGEIGAVPSDAVKPKMLTIKIDDGAKSVNIRLKPTTDSEKIGEAKNGDAFDFVSIDSGWYEVKLANGSTGFIWGKYVEIKEETKN